jgi:Ca2+-binding EF-hand superfamily protein
VKLLKDKLASRGARGIIGLGKTFRIMDDDGSRSLSTYEFNKALHDYGLGFTKEESEDIFGFFDTDRSGSVDYNEFLRAIRGPMNKRRQQKVMQAFKKLDKDGSGWIDINDLRGVYTADRHPEVLQGKKTEDDILNEFLETFEVAHSIREQATPDHVVTVEEFMEYYNNVSSSIDDDDYFVLMMDNAWKLTEESRRGMGTKGWSSN